MSTDKVTVLSAGAGGCTMAFHLTKVGYNVLLYQDEKHVKSMRSILENKEIIALPEYDGYQSPIHGKLKIATVTTNMKEAICHSKIIIQMVPAFGQSHMFSEALPYLTNEHVFFSMPGNFAIFDYVNEIQKYNGNIAHPVTYIQDIPIPCTFVEGSIIPYACRKIQDNEIFVGAVKSFIHTGVFPQSRAEGVYNQLSSIFSDLNIGFEKKDILEVVFYNSNIILHPTITVYNAGHIKHLNRGFRFYKDGVSPLVIKIMERMDAERKTIAQSLGFTLENFSSFYKRYYGDKTDKNLFNFLQEAKFLHFVKAPTDLSGRFISEDLQYVLIPIISFLARKNGLDTPICDSIITSANCMVGKKLAPMRKISEDVWNDIVRQQQYIL